MSAERVVDVVVVGAGIGGLHAAAELVRAGRSVAVLESRDRVGGRLHTRGGMDLGATWFWPDEPGVAVLVRRLGLRTHQQHIDGDAVFHVPGGARRLDGNPIDVPCARFSDGAATLAEAIAAELPAGTVRLNAAVNAVALTADGATVDAAGGRWTSGAVVLALPPALVVERIAFDPPLPGEVAALAAATPVWMGDMTKVVVRYERSFWRASGLAGAAVSHLGPLREIHDMSGPEGEPAALFGFAPSSDRGRDRLRAASIAQLAELFGPRAARPIGVTVADWSTDPHTSPDGVERLRDYGLFGHTAYASPIGGRLHWASTETADRFAGHVEGALVAAERAAAAVIRRTA